MNHPLRLAFAVAVAVVMTLLVARTASYSPGPLMRGHARLSRDCSACHLPWRGAANTACLDCHGDYAMHNPHGKLLVRANANRAPSALSCLNCHTEHRSVSAGDISVNCTQCHEHASIDAVAQHRGRTILRPHAGQIRSDAPYSHFSELTARRKIDPKVEHLPCEACHVRTPDGSMKSNSALPVAHLNVAFAHSPAHLSFQCSMCHQQIERSSSSGDAAALEVVQCFSCHEEATPHARSCAQCHRFHEHGPRQEHDFPIAAMLARPHPAPSFGRSIARRMPHRWKRLGALLLQVWWPGAAGLLVLCAALMPYFSGYLNYVSARRRVGVGAPQRLSEWPLLDDQYQSMVDGLYVVGETVGTSSINLAMRSARQGMDVIANRIRFEPRQLESDVYDVIVVGCGPAGFAASARAKALGLKYLTIEKWTAVGTIRNYPRQIFVQATPIEIDEYGSFYMEGDCTKEELVKRWEEMIRTSGVRILEQTEVMSVAKNGGIFEIKTESEVFKSRFVLMAIGVRGGPRRLGLPNETRGRVFYDLLDPEDYQGKNILVLGGGNAGTEVAQALAAPELHNNVSYSFRTPTLGPPVTPENAEKISLFQAKGLLTAYPASQLTEIKSGKVVLAPMSRGGINVHAGPGAVVLTTPVEIDNDCIFAMLGRDESKYFLKRAGVKIRKVARTGF